MIDEEIKAALGPLIPGKVHPMRRPQDESMPSIVYTVISDVWEDYDTMCGAELSRMRVQTDCYANGYVEARTLAYQAAQALDGIGGRRLNITPFPDDSEKAFRWLVEHYFWRNLSQDVVSMEAGKMRVMARGGQSGGKPQRQESM